MHAIPKTPLHARLEREGRLDPADSPEYGTNVIPLQMSREELRDGYIGVLRDLYEPDAYFDRLDDLYLNGRMPVYQALKKLWRRRPLAWLQFQVRSVVAAALFFWRLMRGPRSRAAPRVPAADRPVVAAPAGSGPGAALSHQVRHAVSRLPDGPANDRRATGSRQYVLNREREPRGRPMLRAEPQAKALAAPVPPLAGDAHLLDVFVRLFREHGDLFKVALPGLAGEALVVCHPDWANHVLVNKYQSYKKGVGYGQMRLLLGNGVITLDTNRWKQQRRILLPVYARSQVSKRLPALAGLPEELVEQWRASADRNEPVDVTRDLSRLVFSMIMTLLCGEDYRRIRGTIVEDRFDQIANSGNRDLDFVSKFAMPVRSTLFEWITRRTERNETHADLLQLLIEARDPVTNLPMAEEQILDECLTFIVAGVETSSTTLAWLWYLLASAPEVEGRLLAEIDGVAGRTLTEETGEHFPCTRQVIWETMRLYPPVWVYPRIAVADDCLDGVPVSRGRTS